MEIACAGIVEHVLGDVGNPEIQTFVIKDVLIGSRCRVWFLGLFLGDEIVVVEVTSVDGVHVRQYEDCKDDKGRHGFEFTFAIGEQVNDNALSFAFYLDADLTDMFSGKASVEHSLAYDGTKGSSLFALGRGMSGHADGHIYKRQAKRPLEAGSRWTAVVDIRNGLKGAPVYVKEWEEPTGIKDLKDSKNLRALKDGNCYDLSGRKVSRLKKGIYLKDGKKILIKSAN